MEKKLEAILKDLVGYAADRGNPPELRSIAADLQRTATEFFLAKARGEESKRIREANIRK